MPFAFDVPTLYFVGAVSSFACGAMLWQSRALHRPSRDLMAWATVTVCGFGAAMLLLSLRGVLPTWGAFALASTIGCATAPLLYETLRRLVCATPRPRTAIGASLAMLAAQASLGIDPTTLEPRLVLLSAAHLTVAALALPLIGARLRGGEDPRAPLRWTQLLLAVFCIGHLLRIVVTLAVGPVMAGDGMVHGPGPIVMPMLFSMSPMLFALVLLALVHGRSSQELRMLATLDPLTGLLNRRSFFAEAQTVLAALAPEAPGPTVLMLDVDRFKSINDRFGHAGGDRVLERFARMLREASPRDALIGRYGGEEFCVLLPSASAEAARAYAVRVCDASRTMAFDLDRGTPPVTVSIGLAAATGERSLDALLLAADRRLYRAKTAGRDRVVWADERVDSGPLPRAAAQPGRRPALARTGQHIPTKAYL